MKKLFNMFFSGIIIIMVFAGSVVDIGLIIKAWEDEMLWPAKIICISFLALIGGMLVGLGTVGIKAIWED